ncbi:right-handed parallel beta-helix repeat-containing protein [Heyndrickxia acidicola]|uniref:Right-handed parallel beta-helix repeat-containing protein n=1 Tax=Heyndrickxia acidicola TaxID=209389 RepID=A0ABU6MC03_9BACI|nr:right-handed parallel beta-helix repeat-containing protein [Heyndrickxia acidicola]MED1201809.1 right-handed parallel beta-helix repeat-containing protein [Heyndrickxia acidicola]
MKKWIIPAALVLMLTGSSAAAINASPANHSAAKQKIGKTSSIDGPVYTLDLKRFGVYNDGTHADSTTNGINAALRWAQANGYKTLQIPDGTYLISKGIKEADPDARINMVSNMTLLLSDKTVLQKETNGFEIYSVIYLGPDVTNAVIKGGTLRGDRDTHDYSQKGPGLDGTHEWGDGIFTEGPQNVVIDGVKILNFTGDGIETGGAAIYGQYITSKDVETGGIDDNGNPIPQKGKVRSNNYNVENFSNPIYQNAHYRNLMMWLPNGVTGYYDLFYYRKDGSFIKAEKNQHFNSTWGYSHIPQDADYFRVVFNANSTKNVNVNRMSVAVTENMTIQNCDIGFNRRQGITVGATDNLQIINNRIHDISGTDPQSGIDIEPGFYPAIHTLIKGNQFNNNVIQMVLSYGGDATVTDNYFGPGGQFSVNPSYIGALVQNNTFDHTDVDAFGNTQFLQNKLISSSAKFEGGLNVTVDGIDGTDSSVGFTQTVKNGIQASNLSFKSSSNSTSTGGISVDGMPITLTNITLKENNSFSGNGNSQNAYNNLTLTNTPEMSLPAGVYTNATSSNGVFELNNPGKTVLNKWRFNDSTLYTYSLNTQATIQNSTFTYTKDLTGPTIVALQAKAINVLNNTFTDITKVKADHAIIQIGRDYSATDPTSIYAASVKGNTIQAKVNREGIDTINGGKAAPPYDIENNTLINTTLHLKASDINKNNQIIKP